MDTLKTGTIKEIGRQRWDSFVDSHPYGGIYHTSAWHEVIRLSYGYQARYHVVLNKDGEIRSGLPSVTIRNLFLGRRLVSFPYSDYCDPLITASGDLGKLCDSVHDLAVKQRARSLEFRMYKTAQGGQESKNNPYCTFVLSLDKSPEDLFRNFHKSCVQRAIRKAKRSGVEITKGETADDLRHFYELHVLTRKKFGVPAQPFQFFENIRDRLSPCGQFSLLLAQNQKRVLAGLILLKFKDTVYYKFGASDPAFLSLCPNQLLFWVVIQQAAREGYRCFDFGRTAKSNSGLMNFKKRWGAKAQTLQYVSTLPLRRTLKSIDQSKLAKIGAHLLRTLPNFTTRLSGELFYRYLG